MRGTEKEEKGLSCQAMGPCIVNTKERRSQVGSALCGKAVRLRIPAQNRLKKTYMQNKNKQQEALSPSLMLYIVIRPGNTVPICRVQSKCRYRRRREETPQTTNR